RREGQRHDPILGRVEATREQTPSFGSKSGTDRFFRSEIHPFRASQGHSGIGASGVCFRKIQVSSVSVRLGRQMIGGRWYDFIAKKSLFRWPGPKNSGVQSLAM